MINFIVCDDNKCVRDINKKIIAKATMPYDFNYTVKTFSCYNENLKKVVNDPTDIKIYLLDIEMPGKSGIEIAKDIRKTDWDSVIIFLTTHEELELKVLKQKLLILDFVSKFDNYEDKIIEAIELVLKKVGSNRTITFKSRQELYHIKVDSILYLYKNSYNQTTIIVTDKEEYEINEPLYCVASKLPKSFIKTHRACYVNSSKVKQVDFAKGIIYFNNGKQIDYISRNYKRNIEEVL